MELEGIEGTIVRLETLAVVIQQRSANHDNTASEDAIPTNDLFEDILEHKSDALTTADEANDANLLMLEMDRANYSIGLTCCGLDVTPPTWCANIVQHGSNPAIKLELGKYMPASFTLYLIQLTR